MYLERLFKESQSKNRKRVEIILTMGIKKEVDRLIKNGLNFRYIRKSVLYFWKVDFKTICYRYYKMGHEKSKACGDRFFMCEIYGRDYYINDYTYNMLIYKARKGRRYLYDLVKCDNEDKRF